MVSQQLKSTLGTKIINFKIQRDSNKKLKKYGNQFGEIDKLRKQIL